MKRYLFLLLASVVVFARCTCGRAPVRPCDVTADCLSGEQCVQGECSSNTDGGNNGNDGGNGNPFCFNLECRQKVCPGGGKTTLTGTVYDPSGSLPLFNAMVYVPNGLVQPFTAGVTCDRCGAVASGTPIAQTTTGPDGKFTLENVPTGADVPLVIQLGRWRRKVTIPNVPECTSTPLTDIGLTRLPKNKTEGDIPQMAIASGDADPFECLLRKIGIEDAEFTLPTGTGRVHYYRANGKDMSPSAPAGTTLWNDLNNLKKYDVVMLPCEGQELQKGASATQNLIDYTHAGGRVFATHYSYVWIKFAQAPWPSVANWNNGQDPVNPYSNPYNVTVETGFPKGNAFADWLVNVSASPSKGVLTLKETRHNVDSVNTNAQRWLHGFNSRQDGGIVTHFTYNTPVNAPPQPDGGEPLQCGRVVFSSFHVSANALSGMPTFPASCASGALTEQEKALAFMLFDLSACVQKDDGPIIQ